MKIFWGYLLLINSVSFLLTAADKWLAIKQKRRLPERSMRQLAGLGGGAGVLAAFYLFRHKTKHKKLLFTVWSITVAETAVILLFFITKEKITAFF